MNDRLRVMIVTDDPVDAERVEGELRGGGLTLESRRVADERAYLAALDDFQPEIVLCRHALRRFDGLRALRLQLERDPHVPFVLVTGSIDEGTAGECLRAGAADYVSMQRLERLGPIVRAALERRRILLERGREERERRDSQERDQATIDALAANLCVIDAQGTIVKVNAAWRAFASSKGGDGSRVLEGSNYLEVCDRASGPGARDARAVAKGLREVLAGERFDFEYEYPCPTPEQSRWFLVKITPFRGDGARHAVIAHVDITERRQSEERFRQLAQAVQQSPASIVITDTEGRIEYVNPSFERLTGYAAAEVQGRNPRFLKSGETPPEIYRELWASISSGRVWHGELCNRRKDGSHFWEAASIAPVRDGEGRITHFVAVKEDITERKRQEELLRHTEQQLGLAQKMEAVGRLAGGVAHDFNNLLSVIAGHAERLRSGMGPEDPARTRLEQILWSTDRAATLTRQLLAFSRRQVLDPRVLRMDAVVAEAEPMLGRVIGEDIELSVISPDALGHVRADPGQLVQILLNLCVNARDAMPRGGRLTVEFADVFLDERYAAAHPPCAPGDYVMMAVTDTGQGMDAATVSRVFEPFFTTKPEGKGTGLGLSTVYGIVKQSGGFIWAYSEPDRGTTFKIYLPRVDEALDTRPAATKPLPSVVSRRGARVLLVEDDASVRELMAEILAAEGYAVSVAGNPAEALGLLEASGEAVDLLLTDVIMPGMSGRDLAQRLGPRMPGMRVLYVSGYAGEAIARHGGIDPGERFLQKPFSESDLLRSVAGTLGATDLEPPR